MATSPPVPETVSNQIFETLKHDLIRGRFAAGEKLAINALKWHYQVGLSPLREALNRLAAYGLLEQVNQRGFRVPAMQLEELDDIASLRTQLESMALTQAFQNGDAEWESRLLGAYHRLKRADEQPQRIEEWEQAHVLFHRALLSSCGSPWLLRFIEQLHDQFDRYRRIAPANTEIRSTLDEQHETLVNFALERSLQASCNLLNEHIRLSTEVARSYFLD